MRKIVVGMFMALDGVVEGPGPSDDFKYAGWTMPYFSDEVAQVIGGNMATSDALLLGRVTYQGFAAAFAPQSGGMADHMNNVRKYVVSNTLTHADWNNSQIIKGDLKDEITKLKQQPGKNISMSGSISVVQALLEYGMIDELSLLVYPVVVGAGKRLFKDGFSTTLKLASTKQLNTGVVHLLYTSS